MIVPAGASTSPPRLVSLDQFRGYTVAGMLLVNFLGSFAVCPRLLRHTNDYVSYADTIMPQFLFAVGFAMRLTINRRIQSAGFASAYLRMVKRLLGLVLVALVVYTVSRRAESWDALVQLGAWGAISEPLKRTWFQTLMHIAVTSLWILPVVHCGKTLRILWMLGSATAHLWLSHVFNFAWVNSPPTGIDGGPIGFLTWTIPAVVGTLACDAFANPSDPALAVRPRLNRIALWAMFLMGLGYVFSCGTRFYDLSAYGGSAGAAAQADTKLAPNPVFPSALQIEAKFSSGNWTAHLAEPPFVAPPGPEQRKWNYWMMSQRSGSLSYLTFAAGFSLLVFLLFYVIGDLWNVQVAFFRTLGTNALLAYVVHDQVSNAVKPFVPGDSPAWYVGVSLVIFFAITWMVVRHFEKYGIYLRV